MKLSLYCSAVLAGLVLIGRGVTACRIPFAEF